MKDKLPVKFQGIIQDILKEDTPNFWQSYDNDPPNSGLRINSLKNDAGRILHKLPGKFSSLPWTEDGYQIEPETNLGKHAFHAAGLYYLQEPSAMVPVEILDPDPGEKILDLCAAPGGKTTQISSKMKNQGWILANDPNPKRVQALKRNLERWGSHNTQVTNESPIRLFEHFGAIFDRVLVDAPCSGEGTFRTNPGAIKKWSPEFIERCGVIQDDILWQGTRLVRPGGIVVYSTCTFNQHENEGTIQRFLDKDPDFYLESASSFKGFQAGFAPSLKDNSDLSKTIRIWPHQAPGEGHFCARLRRAGTGADENEIRAETGQVFGPDQQKLYEVFFNTSIKTSLNTNQIRPDSPLLRMFGNHLYQIIPDAPPLEGLRVEHWGWWIGTFKHESFLPSPALATGLRGEDSQKVLEFSIGDHDLEQYQRGSPIKTDREPDGSGEWILITIEGFPLGWGKIIRGRIKSYLPTWLRIT